MDHSVPWGRFPGGSREGGFLERCQKSAPRQSTGFKWRGSREPHLRTSDRIESSSSRKFSSPIMTAGNRTGITEYSNARRTKERNRQLRKTNAEIGGSAQAGGGTHSARSCQQLPPLRALPEFWKGWKGEP